MEAHIRIKMKRMPFLGHGQQNCQARTFVMLALHPRIDAMQHLRECISSHATVYLPFPEKAFRASPGNKRLIWMILHEMCLIYDYKALSMP